MSTFQSFSFIKVQTNANVQNNHCFKSLSPIVTHCWIDKTFWNVIQREGFTVPNDKSFTATQYFCVFIDRYWILNGHCCMLIPVCIVVWYEIGFERFKCSFAVSKSDKFKLAWMDFWYTRTRCWAVKGDYERFTCSAQSFASFVKLSLSFYGWLVNKL